MNMKKMITVFLAIILVFVLAACDKDTNTTVPETSGINSEINNKEDTNTNQTEGTKPTSPTEGSDKTENPQGGGDPTDRDEKDETNGNGEQGTKPTTPVETPTDPTQPHTHSYTTKATKPTCTKDGYTTYTCATCGDSYIDDKVQATEHSYGNWVTTKEPTTTSTGKAERKCTTCGHIDTRVLDVVVDEHTHTHTARVTKEATCQSTGVKTFTCVCGDTYTTPIAKLDHPYDSVVTKPTCTTDGYTVYTCPDCGDSYTGAKISALQHNYKDVVTAPTCAEKGYTTHTCTRCGYSHVDTYTDKTNAHTHVAKQTKAPTCTADGVMTHTCSVCKHSYTTAISKLGHNYKVTSDTKATCTTDGKKIETCANCKGTKTTVTAKATGHQHTRVEDTSSSCSAPGYTRTICTDCNAIISQVEKPTTAHAYTKTMRVSDAAKILHERGLPLYGEYMIYDDWVVEVCAHCGQFSRSEIRFAYTPLEAAEIMMGYVNALRAEVHGDAYDPQKHDLKIHDFLLNRATWVAMEKLPYNYGHSNQADRYDAAENICHDGPNLINQFNAWKQSPAHYRTMIDLDNRYFGYAIGWQAETEGMAGGPGCIGGWYGCQLFFSIQECLEYARITGDYSGLM